MDRVFDSNSVQGELKLPVPTSFDNWWQYAIASQRKRQMRRRTEWRRCQRGLNGNDKLLYECLKNSQNGMIEKCIIVCILSTQEIL